jgi:hypothetical protein
MAYQVLLTTKVSEVLDQLKAGDQRKTKKVVKALALLEADPAYPGLASHRFDALDKTFDQTIWESYVENDTPSAWRIWWYFGPDQGQITVVDVGPHP